MNKFLTLSLACLALASTTASAQVSAQKQETSAQKAREGRSDAEIPVLSTLARALVDRTDSVVVSAWGGTLTFEGSTEDAFETSIAITDPTADRTATVPDASGTVELLTVHTEAATDTLAANQLYGGLIVNTGAAGAVVYTLPAPAVGMHFRVYLTAAQDVDINAANGTQILALTNATGDAISSAATIGNCIELVALSTTTWAAFAVSGSWTDVN